jgi:hypothetical protein
MSIRRLVLEEIVFEPYQRSTQYIDLMFQKPNGTEQLASQQCGKKVNLIGVDALKTPTIELIRNKIKKLVADSGQNHQCHNYRGYPIVIKYDGPIRDSFYLILVNEPEKHIELLKVTQPAFGI